MTNISARWRATLPAVFWFLLIMVLLSLPGRSFPVIDIWKPDKLAHVGLFGMQTLLLWIALAFGKRLDRDLRLALVRAAGYTVLFSILSEMYQHLFTTRMADIYDVLANWVGIILTFLLVVWIGLRRILGITSATLRLPQWDSE